MRIDPYVFFFFSSRRRHTRSDRDWSSDVCSSDLALGLQDLLNEEVSPAPRAGPPDLHMPSFVEGWNPPAGGLVPTTAASRPGPRTLRSEERRVGKESRSRWSPYH